MQQTAEELEEEQRVARAFIRRMQTKKQEIDQMKEEQKEKKDGQMEEKAAELK